MEKCKFILIILLFGLMRPGGMAQLSGGKQVFSFLNLPASARITGLGGHYISSSDDDVVLALANPASLNSGMSGQIALNHQFIMPGIHSGYAAFGFQPTSWETTLHSGIQYLSYGTFSATDVVGNVQGTFKAADYAITLGAGRQLYERVSIGGNVRFITSQLENYRATGISTDIAFLYNDTTRLFLFTMVVKNLGTQLSTYTGDKRKPLPTEAQVALSKRLRYLPFRFSVLYRYLDRWNILYEDPNAREELFFFGEEVKTRSNVEKWLDNLARHFVVGGEFLLDRNENFRLRIGYNHLQRKEMSVRNLRSFSGFSLGFGFKISRFRIEYGRFISHLGAGINHLSISTKLLRQS